MPQFYKKLSFFVGLSLAACGQGPLANLRGRSSSAPSSPAPAPAADPAALVQAAQASPPRTRTAPPAVYLATGTVIPSPLKASTLVLGFQANNPAATFECLPDAHRDWQACNNGAGYDFGRLVHRRGYMLRVRARTADGLVSEADLMVTFVADLVDGTSPTLPREAPASAAATVLVPQDATALPVPAAPLANATAKAVVSPATPTPVPTSRILQVGSYFAFNVPSAAEVTGYATDRTYNGTIVTMTLLASGLSSFLNTPTCDLDYQKVVTTAGGTQYCDGTPTAAQLALQAGGEIPHNFIDVAWGDGAGAVTEKILVAAFEGSSEGADIALSLGNRCSAAAARGSSALPILPQYAAPTALTETVTWCQESRDGAIWWVALIAAPLPDGSHLKILYSASAPALGLFTGTQFVDRVTQHLAQLLQAIAPFAT